MEKVMMLQLQHWYNINTTHNMLAVDIKIKMYLFLVIATSSDLLLYGLLKQLNVCEK